MPVQALKDFTSVPVVDYDLVNTDKATFIAQLRHALIYVGFLYLDNPPVQKSLIDSLMEYTPRLFALPQEDKDRIAMRNSPAFLGYTRFGAEFTQGVTDSREQFDFGTPYVSKWAPGKPDYLKSWGESQWPDEELLPGFRQTMEAYITQVGEMSFKFSSLVAEALGLSSDALEKFYDNNPTVENIQQRCKVMRYPPAREGDSKQGVGAHFDPNFLAFLLQVSAHEGLQVQNMRGEWIPVSPIPGTFVVNIGKALETVTRGAAKATSHRVVSPSDGPGSIPGSRYSVAVFQNISQTCHVYKEILELRLLYRPGTIVPEEVMALVHAREDVYPRESINFQEYDYYPTGLAKLIGRIRSHPDVAERHYPELFRQYFPNGIPS